PGSRGKADPSSSIQERRAFFGCDMNTWEPKIHEKLPISQHIDRQDLATSVHGEFEDQDEAEKDHQLMPLAADRSRYPLAVAMRVLSPGRIARVRTHPDRDSSSDSCSP